MSEKKYDGPPSTFVNTKRVKTGEDSKGRNTVTVTFGLTKNQAGEEVNTLIQLVEALGPLAEAGKQANITIHMEEKEAGNGRSFLSAFARVTEMIPRDAGGGPQGGGRGAFVPKTSKTADIKARAEVIRKQTGG